MLTEYIRIIQCNVLNRTNFNISNCDLLPPKYTNFGQLSFQYQIIFDLLKPFQCESFLYSKYIGKLFNPNVLNSLIDKYLSSYFHLQRSVLSCEELLQQRLSCGRVVLVSDSITTDMSPRIKHNQRVNGLWRSPMQLRAKRSKCNWTTIDPALAVLYTRDTQKETGTIF